MTFRDREQMLDAMHADSVVAASAAGRDVTAPPPPEPPADEFTDAHEARLLTAVQEYTDALDAGRKINRRELIGRYPDIADDLSACLAGLAFVESAAAQIGGDVGGGTRAIGTPPRRIEGVGTAEPLGDFQLLREIGRGGMGVVYEAVQRSLGRRVAVKVLPLAAALDSKHLQRFRNEAQAAAQLHHGNIVPVYAVGCERSVHFYAMQLIEGQSLAEVYRELRAARDAAPPPRSRGRISSASMTVVLSDGSARSDADHTGAVPAPPPSAAPVTGPRPAMGLNTMRENPRRGNYYRAIAKLGVQVADALEYAHRSGVVHRDVKPANILLDGLGTPWVTDFGLAQFYTDAELTQTGDMLGTLRYMSPEQASGRAVVLDQRTDIYSLGITLYELLALEPAYTAASHDELAGQIRWTDPRPLRLLDRSVPAELATIVAKATNKEPGDRYATAAAMADDIRRYLDDEPILARPPSKVKRAGRWVRRHRAVSVAAAVFAGLLGIGSGVAAVLIAAEEGQTRQAYAETRKAYAAEQSRRVDADNQRRRADENFAEARQVVDFLSQVAARQLADAPEAAQVRKAMLQAALDYYQNFLRQHQDDAAENKDLADARLGVQALLDELTASESLDRVQARASLLYDTSVDESVGIDAASAARAARAVFSLDTVSAARGDFAGSSGGSDGGTPYARLSSKQKLAKFNAAARAAEKVLVENLTAPQLTRLVQIDLQVHAPASLDDPAVTRALDLSKAQRDQVRTLQGEARATDGVQQPAGGHGGPPPPNNGGPFNRLTVPTATLGRFVALLTPEQTETWNRLVGTPFVPKSQFNRDRGGFGRGGGNWITHDHGGGGPHGPDHDRMGDPDFDGGPPMGGGHGW